MGKLAPHSSVAGNIVRTERVTSRSKLNHGFIESHGSTGQNGNHLFVLEARAGRERTLAFLGCEGRQDVEPTAVRGQAAQWIHCRGGETLNAGHVMLVWIEDGVRYVVSLHSDTPTNRSIAAAVAGRLKPVRPPGQ